MSGDWYLLAYDVSGARPSQQVHRCVRQQAHFLLESLYLRQGDASAMAQWHMALRKLAGPSAPDVVMYRMIPNRPMHVFGTARPLPGMHLLEMPARICHGPRPDRE